METARRLRPLVTFLMETARRLGPLVTVRRIEIMRTLHSFFT